MRTDERDIEETDEYGPGSDLVLSLLSVVILVLGLVGVGQRLPAQTPPQPFTARKDAAVASAEQQLAQLKDENSRLAEELRVALEQKDKGREPMISIGEIVEVKGFEPFLKNRNQLSEPGKAAIIRQIGGSLELLSSSTANMLLIEGHASPEPNRREGSPSDVNLDLSALRAASVAHFLNEKGVPYACMAVVGHGRARSKLIRRIIGKGGNEAMVQWDQLFGDATFRQELQTRFDEALRGDRRIVMRAVQDDTSYCQSQQLLQSLALLAKLPPK